MSGGIMAKAAFHRMMRLAREFNIEVDPDFRTAKDLIKHIGPVPYKEIRSHAAEPSVSRKNLDKGYVKGNIRWEPQNQNISEIDLYTPCWVEFIRLGKVGVLLQPGRGGIRPDKAIILLQVLKAVNPEKIIEIGFNQGKSSWLFLNNIPDTTKLVSIDIGDHECVFPNSEYFSKKFKNFTFVLGDSMDVLQTELEKLESIDFAFVDGGHDYQHCLFDLYNCAEKLSEKGVMCCDDYNKFQHERYPGVKYYRSRGVEQACDEMKKELNWHYFPNEGTMIFSKSDLSSVVERIPYD